MYLVAIHVPVCEAPDGQMLVDRSWLRSLELLRDSFEGRFGSLVVACPVLRIAEAHDRNALAPADADGIEFRPGIEAGGRVPAYWLRQRRAWLSHLEPLIQRAEVVHAGLDNALKPISYDAFDRADRAGKPTVFVRDIDAAESVVFCGSILDRAQLALMLVRYDRLMRSGVRRASLSLLKGDSLMRRFGSSASNLREIQDTSYSLADVIEPAELAARLAHRARAGRLSLVYAGRLIERKGVEDSIRALAGTRTPGCTLTIIGDGELRPRLEELARELGVGDRTRFLGTIAYGERLHQELRRHDALLFTPTAPDTPRMIFDAFAAGLPLIGRGISYVRERARQEGATIVLEDDDRSEWGSRIDAVAADTAMLDSLSHEARRAGLTHAAETWYRQRAEWTIEAVERFRGRTRAVSPGPSADGV